MQCNIDAKGKAARLIYGLILLVAAGILTALILLNLIAGGWVWLIVTGLALMGAFSVFEARAGWCVVRAMGIKTKW